MRRIDLRALALDAYGYASHNVKKCPGIFYKGGCEGRGRPVPGYVYCAKCMRANEAKESKARTKDADTLSRGNATAQAAYKKMQALEARPWTKELDAEHNALMKIYRANGGETWLSKNASSLLGLRPKAKDQVPQDCFDAQILGV